MSTSPLEDGAKVASEINGIDIKDDDLFMKDDDDEEEGEIGLSKNEGTKQAGKVLTAVEMDALAQWKWLNGRLGESIDGYLELARMYPKYLHVHFKLGYLNLILQNYDSAILHLSLEIDKQMQVQPLTNVRRAKILAQRAYYWCSVAGRMEAYHYLQNEEKETIDKHIIEKDGGDVPEAYVAMGCLYRQLGLLQRAESCFDQASLASPNDPAYLVEYGKLLLLQRRSAQALAKFSDCRRVSPPLSEELFQAMLGEAVASMRMGKPLVAQGILKKVTESLSPMVEQGLTPLLLNSDMDRLTIRNLLYQSINSQGCCAILQGDIKGALDIYYTVMQDFGDFQLPVMCITPGARDAKGHLVDTCMFSTERVVDLLLYLDQIESRYGPDACLYFHRANIYRALGDLSHFIDDLTLVETLDPFFLRNYFLHDSLGDFLDDETMTWVPLHMLESVFELSNPPATGLSPVQSTTIEAAIYQYFETRLLHNKDDYYARLYAVDSLRRLNMADQLPLDMYRLRKAYGISFDDSLCHLHRHECQPPTARALVVALLVNHSSDPMVHFIAGLVYMSEIRLDSAHHHFTQCIQELNKVIEKIEETMIEQGLDIADPPDGPTTWKYHGNQRALYHALVWRAVISRLMLKGPESVGDMRTASNLMPSEPHAMFQKAAMMVHYGMLDNVMKPLRDGHKQLKAHGLHRSFHIGRDYMQFAGMNVFSLLPQELRKAPPPKGDEEEEQSTKRKNSEGGKGGSVLYSNALDKMYEAGVLKLSRGQIAGSLKYFETITSIKETYMSAPIVAMQDLHRCRDSRLIDEKVYYCHQHLAARAVRFRQVFFLPFEAYKDMTACISYYPHDIDTYWSRANLFKEMHNYEAAIEDYSQCIALTRQAGKPRGIVLKRYKKMILARATAYMRTMQWELAHDDLNEVIMYALKESTIDTSYLVYVCELRCRVLVALRHYSVAITEMEKVLDLSKDRIEWNDNSLLNMLLLGNLHCHMAIEIQKRHHVGMYTTYLFPTKESPLLSSAHTSIQKANAYYTRVLEHKQSFPLALFLKGRMHALLGESKQAINFLTKCLRLHKILGEMCSRFRRQDPKFLVANFLKGSLRLQQCLPDMALAEFLMIRNHIPAYPHLQTSIGYCYYLRGNIKRAIVELTEALVHDPKDTTALYTRGVCLQELLALSSAIRDFTETLKCQSNHWRALYQRGMCYLLLKDYTSALVDLSKAVPHIREAYVAMGYIHFCKRMYSDAIEAYSRFLDERSNDAKILLYRAFSFYLFNEHSLAARDFEKALNVDSGCWFAYFIKAFIYQEENQGDKAMHSISKCINHFKNVKPFAEVILPINDEQSNPFFGNRVDATLDRLKFLLPYQQQDAASVTFIQRSTTGKRMQLREIFVKAVRRILFQARVVYALEKFAFRATSASLTQSKHIDELIQVQTIQPPQGTFTPDSVAWAYNLMGILSASQMKWEEALRNFTLAVAAAPSKPIPHLNRGNVYIQTNNYNKALIEYKEALKVDPNHVATMTNAAVALRKMNQLEEACRYLYNAASAVETGPSHDTVDFALANVIRELNRFEEAIEWYTKAIADHTPILADVAVYHNRGATYHGQLKYARALEDYSVALSLEPKSFATRFNRAQLFILNSKCFQAMKDLKVATSLPQSTDHAQRLLRFCERWSSVLRVACSDFLYAFHVFPCFVDLDISMTTPLWDPHVFRFQNLSVPDHPSVKNLDVMLNRSDAPEYSELVRDALYFTKAGKFDNAQRSLLAAKYTKRTSPEEKRLCLIWCAEIEMHQGHTATAIASLQEAIHDNEVHAHTEDETGDSDGNKAMRTENQLLDTSDAARSVQSDLYGMLGCLLRQNGQEAEALEAFESSVAQNPLNVYSLFNAASMYYQRGDFASVLESLTSIIHATVSALDEELKNAALHGSQKSQLHNDLLYVQRNFKTMFPKIESLLHFDTIRICQSIHTILVEYRTCLSCHVAKHIPQLCTLQGKLAIQVEGLRDAVINIPPPSKTALHPQNSRSNSRHLLRAPSMIHAIDQQPAIKHFDLNELNQAIEQCSEEMLKNPNTITDLASKALTRYTQEFDKVCARINAAKNTSMDLPHATDQRAHEEPLPIPSIGSNSIPERPSPSK